MKKLYQPFVCLTFIAILLLPTLLVAGIWDTMNYQGILLDDEGARVNGLKTITFSIWDSQTSGAMFWEEMHIVNVSDGVVSVVLGSTTPLTSLSGADQYWLQVQVTGDDAMPRIKMTSVPYAFNARYLQAYAPGNNTLNIPINNGAVNTSLNADKLDGFDAGNESLKIPLSNGTVNTNLNADLLDGSDATDFAEADHTHNALTITDEPGIAWDTDSTSIDIETTPTTIAERAISAPAAGYALVIATAEFSMSNASAAASLNLGVTTTEGTLLGDGDHSWAIPDTIAEFEHSNVITVQHVFTVTAGSNTFYFQAYAADGNTSAAAINRYLSVVYLPSAYGASK